MEGLYCPLCGGPGSPLGQMGNVYHLRCRDCGADYHAQPEAPAEPAQSVPFVRRSKLRRNWVERGEGPEEHYWEPKE